MSKNKNKINKVSNRIVQGGFRDSRYNPPDVVLQMPELFLFDMKDYMDSIRMAREIDYSQRVRLYDMYDSAQLDLHLSGVLAKRLRGVTRFPIEFQRNGISDENINKQLQSPWFKKLRKDIILSEFWGFSLMQFYLDDKGNICYDLIDRKHYDPIRRKLLKYQGDQDGIDIDAFDNMLFVGEKRDLGIFSELLPAVLYKRGDMSDWAIFCNIFGMPIREYTYDAGDEDARRDLVASAKVQGRNAVYIHPEGSSLHLIESGNKTGSSELYKSFAEYWDGKISIRVLGNTLTTDSKDKGTQALGTVHKEEEDNMNEDDRETILDVLNYDMTDIFRNLGFNVDGGEFIYAKKEKMDPTTQLTVVQGLQNMGLPLDDDWLYETFAVKKPDDYQQKKDDAQARKDAFQKQLEGNKNNQNENLNSDKKPFKNRLMGFFGIAPQDGAEME
jgi:phage gp29-like protein